MQLTYFPMRLDSESVQVLEEIAEKTGFGKSTLARNAIHRCLVEKRQAKEVIESARLEKFGKNNRKGDNGRT